MRINNFSHYRLTLLFLLIFCTILFSQQLEVNNVRFEDKGNKIVVYYDLQGKSGKKYSVSISLSYDYGRTFDIRPQKVLGDIGQDIEPGENKRISWNIKVDYPEGLKGEGFVFAVDAELQKESKKWPYFLAGAAGLAGGFMYYLSSKAEKEKSTTGSIIFDVPTDF